MLKKYLFIAAAIFAVIGFQSQAFAVPTSELVFTADMTKEQLQAELAKADDIEAAVTAAILAGVGSVDVVEAAIEADFANSENIKARALEVSPQSEHAAILAVDDGSARAAALRTGFGGFGQHNIAFSVHNSVQTAVQDLLNAIKNQSLAGGAEISAAVQSQARNGG